MTTTQSNTTQLAVIVPNNLPSPQCSARGEGPGVGADFNLIWNGAFAQADAAMTRLWAKLRTEWLRTFKSPNTRRAYAAATDACLDYPATQLPADGPPSQPSLRHATHVPPPSRQPAQPSPAPPPHNQHLPACPPWSPSPHHRHHHDKTIQTITQHYHPHAITRLDTTARHATKTKHHKTIQGKTRLNQNQIRLNQNSTPPYQTKHHHNITTLSTTAP